MRYSGGDTLEAVLWKRCSGRRYRGVRIVGERRQEPALSSSKGVAAAVCRLCKRGRKAIRKGDAQKP
jgi:hypothetical protein